jgi:tRNA(fMet)-specific endonuclease VapC
VNLRYLLDTSIVSLPISKLPNPAVLKQLEAHGDECAIAAPVWNELRYGCQRLPKGKRRDAIATYLEDVVLASFPVLPYDETAAHWHGLEHARLEALGKPAPYVDGQIAAIAHVHELKLVTTNTKDFARFKDIEVENWTKRRVLRDAKIARD